MEVERVVPVYLHSCLGDLMWGLPLQTQPVLVIFDILWVTILRAYQLPWLS